MDNRPLVTVYTQNYNKSAWIGTCIESVLNQSYDYFEYLICDHGSQDNSMEIIERYAKKDNRIKVFSKSNAERGFIPELIAKEGNGKYFVMIDSDDYMTEDNLEKLVEFAERNRLDIASCGAYAFDGEGQISVLREAKRQLLYAMDSNSVYFNEMYPFLRTIWGKIIRRQLIEEADFSVYRINALDYVAEDTAFVLAIYEKSTRIGLLTDKLIYYRVNNNSVSERYNKRQIQDYENVYHLSLKILGKLSDTTEENLIYIKNVFWTSVVDGLGLLIKSTFPLSEILEELKLICQNPLVRKMAVEIPLAAWYMAPLIGWVGEKTQILEGYTKRDMENLVEVVKFLQLLP